MSVPTSALKTAPSLQVRDLTVGYRARGRRCNVLTGIDLTARAGQLVCLLGANGTGKSTLLRTIVGLQPALAGHIALDGKALRTLTPTEIARCVGVVLTERVVVDALSARRIVEFGRFAHSGWWGGVTDRDREAVQRALTAAGAAHLGDRDFNRLSDGERQRVMMARALAQEPSLLVLDEPTAFLDVSARVEMWGLLRHLAVDRGLAVVVSTHDLELALRMAGVIWLVTRERTVAVGSPAEMSTSGAIDAAFATDNVHFDPVERVFRLGPRATERMNSHAKH